MAENLGDRGEKSRQQARDKDPEGGPAQGQGHR